MAVGANTWTIGAVVASDNVPAVTWKLTGIEDFSINPGIEAYLTRAAGQPDVSYAAIMTAEPVIEFTCTDVSTALAAIDELNGAAITAATSVHTVDVYFTKSANKSSRTTGSTHLKATISNGLIVPRTLECAHRGKATLRVEIHALSTDGVTVPITFTNNTALVANPAVLDEQYTLGPGAVNGTALNDVMRLSVDFGFQLYKTGSEGNPYPHYVCIEERNPKLTVETLDTSLLTSFGVGGVAQGATASKWYLRKMSEGQAGRVANGTTEHISITSSASQGMFYPGSVGSSNNQTSNMVLEFQPVAGSSDIWTIATGVAIT